MQAGVLRLQHRLAILVPDELTVRVLDLHQHAGSELQRDPCPVDDVRVPFDLAIGVRKDQAGIALRAGELPFGQDAHKLRGEGDSPVTGFRLWGADLLVGVSTLGDVQLPLFEIHVSPTEAAQLARSQSGKNGCQEERPPPPLGGLDDSLDLVGGGDVDPDLEFPVLAPGCTTLFAALTTRSKLSHHIARDLTALLSLSEDGSKASPNLLD